jgi:PAS domain S-box-containing protein/putative nucleotidyltransferase with HDIG domain
MKEDDMSGITKQQIKALMIDDSEDDVLLILRELKKGGYLPDYQRIETAAAMKKALKESRWDIVLCDYKMPNFSAPSAIDLLKKTNIDLPIIIISGTIGEETAIECMRLGAQDYIMKSNLSRLCPAIARELEEAKIRFHKQQSEVLLLQSEEKYRTILENIEDGYYEVDLTGNFTFFNDAVCRILGYSREELTGMNNRQFTDKENAEILFQTLNQVYKTGQPTKGFDWQVIRKNGSKRFIEASVSLIEDNAGKPSGFRGIIRDITERKEMYEHLLNEEQKFRALAEQSSDIILLANRKGTIVYENQAVHPLLGYHPEDRIGASSLENIHPDDVKQNMAQFRKIFQDVNAPVLRTEVRLRHKDGSWRTFEEVASGLTRDHFVESVVINLRDITERKRAEDALSRSERYFKEITENSFDMIIITDESGMIKYCSPSIERYAGYKPEEVIGKSGFMFIHPEELERASRDFGEAVLMKENPPPTNAFRIIHQDGTERYFYGIGKNLLDNPDVAGIVMNIRDITEQKKAEQALKDSEAKYRNIFENAMEGIYQVTLEGKFITVNSALARMAGYDSPEEFIESINDIKSQLYVHLEDRDRLLAIMTDKGLVENFEVQFLKKDRSVFWVVLNARMVRDKQGNALYNEGLVEDITQRKQTEDDLKQSLERLKKAVSTTINVLLSALEIRDPYTAGHQSRVALLACAIAKEMGMDDDKIESIRTAGIIHDIGKLSVPVEILSKPTRLTSLEYSLIKEHAQSGFEMLKDVEPSRPLAEIVHQHHERMDGSGYPNNLKGNEILIEARILSVADVVEAMASHRPYRASLGINVALEEIEKNKGILYDEAVANACLKLFREKGFVFE